MKRHAIGDGPGRDRRVARPGVGGVDSKLRRRMERAGDVLRRQAPA